MYNRVVFVFGSNLSGIHGAGAAWDAAQHWGAEWGVGQGPTGDAYALATKDEDIITLSYDRVRENISDFFDYARTQPETLFLLTPVGTGLAGLDKRIIWSYCRSLGIPSNVALTSSWVTG